MHNLQGIMHNSLFRVNFNISRISVTNILGLKLTEIKDIVMTLIFLYQLLQTKWWKHNWHLLTTVKTCQRDLLMSRLIETTAYEENLSVTILCQWKCHLKLRYNRITGIRFSLISSMLKVWFFKNFCVQVKVYWKQKKTTFEVAVVAVRNCVIIMKISARLLWRNRNLRKFYTFLELSILKKGSKTNTRQKKRSYCFLLLSTPNNSLSTDTLVHSSWMLLSVLNKYFKQTIYWF